MKTIAFATSALFALSVLAGCSRSEPDQPPPVAAHPASEFICKRENVAFQRLHHLQGDIEEVAGATGRIQHPNPP